MDTSFMLVVFVVFIFLGVLWKVSFRLATLINDLEKIVEVLTQLKVYIKRFDNES